MDQACLLKFGCNGERMEEVPVVLAPSPWLYNSVRISGVQVQQAKIVVVVVQPTKSYPYTYLDETWYRRVAQRVHRKLQASLSDNWQSRAMEHRETYLLRRGE